MLTHTEVVALYGSPEGQLERVRWRNSSTGEETEQPIRHLTLPRRGPGNGLAKDAGIALDSKNFVLTGWDAHSAIRSKSGAGRPLQLETSVGGVFAAGDVRSGSVKRVGAAIGEGAVVGAELHIALANGQVRDKSERSASQDARETANALTVPS